MIHLIWADYVTIAAYFLAMMAIGVWFSRRQKGGGDFFAGGRRIPWWVAGVSLYMANFSAFMYTGNAAFTYEAGLFSFLYWSCIPLAYFAGTLLTASRWRRTRSVSPVEFTRTRFNPATQQMIALVLSVLFILTTGTQLYAVANIIGPALQLPIALAIAGIGVVAVAYTMTGGLWAVTVCDFLQFVVLLAVTAIVVPLAIGEVGGWSAFLDRLPAFRPSLDFRGMRYDGLYIVGNVTAFALGAAQGGGQLFYSVRDEKAARRVGFMAAGLFALNPFLFCIVPMVARMLWPAIGDIPVAPGTPTPENQIFALICYRVLPTGTMGFFLAAALSATMDNLSVTANMISSLFTRDLYPALIRRPLDDRGELRLGRWASLVVGILVIGMSLVVMLLDQAKPASDPDGRSGMALFNQMVTYISLLAPPITIPIVLGLRMRTFPRWGGVAAITWGLILGFSTQMLFAWPVGPRLCLVLGGTLLLGLLSPHIGSMGRKSPAMLFLSGTTAAAVTASLLVGIRFQVSPGWLPLAMGALLGMTVIGFGALFAKESAEDQKPVDEFFARLATPVDVEKEVLTS